MAQHHTDLGAEQIAAIQDVFWREGYHDASIEAVVRATGRNRYSLYNDFGGKRDLFLVALDAYYIERKMLFLNALHDGRSAPLDAIAKVFRFAIGEMAKRGAGCLMCNVAAELGRQDALISERVRAYLQEIECAYAAALERAAERGELKTNVHPGDGAAMLMAVKLGLGVRAKNGAGPNEMTRAFNAALAALSKVPGEGDRTKPFNNRRSGAARQ